MLAHELVFGAFLFVTAARLALAAGPFDGRTLLFAGLLAGQALTSRAGWLVRLFWFPVAMLVAYAGLGPAMAALHPGKADGLLIALDQFIAGGHLGARLPTHPALTELMTVCYVLFFPYLLLGLIRYSRRDLETAKTLFAGLFTIYGVGFLSYTLLPAQGPWVALAGRYAAPLEGGPLFRLHDWIVRSGTNGCDVFPSLHCALTAFMLVFDRVHDPKRFRRWLVPVALLWVSTVYLRYHYVVDVLAGFGLAAAALSAVAGARAGGRAPRAEALPRPS